MTVTPTLMILPFGLATEALREYNARRLSQFMDAMPAANADAPELTMEQINQLVHEQIKMIGLQALKTQIDPAAPVHPSQQ